MALAHDFSSHYFTDETLIREDIIADACDYARDHPEAYYEDVERIFWLLPEELDCVVDETYAYRRRQW